MGLRDLPYPQCLRQFGEGGLQIPEHPRMLQNSQHNLLASPEFLFEYISSSDTEEAYQDRHRPRQLQSQKVFHEYQSHEFHTSNLQLWAFYEKSRSAYQ